MTKEPFFSIIIPTYNRLEFCLETVKSVLNQTFCDYEIIVIDDGSSDGTKEYFEKAAFSESLIYLYKENGGVSSARNLGIKISKGKYLCYLDSDDTWQPNKLQKVFDVIQQHETPIIFHDFVKHDIRNKEPYKDSNSDIFSRIYKILKPTNNKLIFEGKNQEPLELILSGYPFYPSVITIKRSVHDQYLWDPGVLKSEDFNLLLKLSMTYGFTYLNESLAVIKVHEGNKSKDTKTKDRVILNTMVAVKSLYSTSATDPVFNKYLGSKYFHIGIRHVKNGNLRIGIPWILIGLFRRITS